MPNSTLSSFISSNQFGLETSGNPLFCGMIVGNTYNTGFTFGAAAGPTMDPGGLFGWLVYSKAILSNPKTGTTGDNYIVYTSPLDLVGDLNKLQGISGAILTSSSGGYTHALFKIGSTTSTGVNIIPQTIGEDFLYALNYLSYGGNLILAPTTTGFDEYKQDGNYFDVVIAKQIASTLNGTGVTLVQWLTNQETTFGIFPSKADSSGITGRGLTMADYGTLLGSSYLTILAGTTVANRFFNVYGTKTITDFDVSSLQSGAKITYTINAVPDVAGFFTRAKKNNLLYLTVAGINNATVLNGKVTEGIEWSNGSLKTALRTNRVNFFVNYSVSANTGTKNFLGSDLTGTTANATILSDDRIGPANIKVSATKILNDIGLRYLYQVNNAQTRAQIKASIQSALDPLAPFLDTAATQIICDSSNNTDNSGTLTMELVLKPILSIESFGVTVTLTQ
jgi:hypothetical protein